MDESVGSAPAGIARWLTIHDDLLRGLTHALSNRVGTIAATAYLVELQPASLPATAAVLREEGDRLDALVHLMRLLPRRATTDAEPVLPAELARQALALQAFHPALGEIPVAVQQAGDAQPAYVEPGALVMALTVAVGAAQRAAGHGGQVTVTMASTTESVEVTTCGWRQDGTAAHVDGETTDDVHAVNWLLRPFGGSGAGTASGVTILVPTLQAARRAQRR